MPDLTKFELTPFVTKEMEPTKWEKTRPDGTTYEPAKVDGMELLRRFKVEQPGLYEWWIENVESPQQGSATAQTETRS